LIVVDAFDDFHLLCQAKVDCIDGVLWYLLEFHIMFRFVKDISQSIEDSRDYRASQRLGFTYVLVHRAIIVIEAVHIYV
jgi:hypothetical protein